MVRSGFSTAPRFSPDPGWPKVSGGLPSDLRQKESAAGTARSRSKWRALLVAVMRSSTRNCPQAACRNASLSRTRASPVIDTAITLSSSGSTQTAAGDYDVGIASTISTKRYRRSPNVLPAVAVPSRPKDSGERCQLD